MRHIERPFPGLRSFAKNESAIFFGRDEQTATMIDRMSRSHFLCITGPSGCGKSSLGRTGLMNGLEAGFLAGAGSDWVFVDHRPEDQPMRNLCEALALAIRDDEQSDITISPTELADSLEETLRASPRRLPEMIDHLGAFKNREVLLFVDQFEELFRFAQRDRNEASAFIETLTTTAARESNIRVAITTRIESLEHSSYFDGLSQAIAKGLFLTPSMDRFQLQQAIEGPAELFSGKIDPDFSLWLLNQMDGQADQLPLMQHTLRVLWERKGAVSDGPPTLTREDFDTYFQRRGTGDGVRRDALEEALTAHLNEVYGAMSEDDQVLSRRMFCALADPLSTRRDNRTPQYVRSLAEISGCKVNDVIRVLDPFRADGADFLLPPFQEMLTPETQIDIRHEAILRRWVPLSGTWLQDEARNGERMQTYARNARDYANGDDELLRGTRLDTAEDWVQRAKPNAGWGRRFLRNIDWMVQDKTETAPRRMVPDEVFDKTMDYVQQSKHAEDQRLELRLAERNRLRKLKKRRRSAVALAMFSVFSFLPIGYILWKTYGGGFLDSQRIGAIEDDLVSRGIFMSNDSLGATLYTRLTPEERETADALAPEVLAAEKAHENRLADWKKKFQKTPDPGVPTEVELDKLERVAAEGEGAESVWVGRLINSMMENEGGCAPLPQWSRPPFAADGFAGCQLPVRQEVGIRAYQQAPPSVGQELAADARYLDFVADPGAAILFDRYRDLIDKATEGDLAFPKFAASAAIGYKENQYVALLSRYTAWSYATMKQAPEGLRRAAAWQCLEAARQQACRMRDVGYRYNDVTVHIDAMMRQDLFTGALGSEVVRTLPDGTKKIVPTGPELALYRAAVNGVTALQLKNRFDELIRDRGVVDGGIALPKPGNLPELSDQVDRIFYLNRNIARAFGRSALGIARTLDCKFWGDDGGRLELAGDCKLSSDFYGESAGQWLAVSQLPTSLYSGLDESKNRSARLTHAYTLRLLVEAWLGDPLLREFFTRKTLTPGRVINLATEAYIIRKNAGGDEFQRATYLTRKARAECIDGRIADAHNTLVKITRLSEPVGEELRTHKDMADCNRRPAN